MKAHLARLYRTEIYKPTQQTQRTMVGIFIRRTIGKGLRNIPSDLLTQADEKILTENNNYLITQRGGLPVRTFRVIRGNGYAGSELGEIIQHQFDRVIPSSINNFEGQGARDALTAAVAAWQALTPTEKKEWTTQAQEKHLHMSGYNLYVKTYILNLIATTVYLLLETGSFILLQDGYRLEAE
jgi:hypothetical protein